MFPPKVRRDMGSNKIAGEDLLADRVIKLIVLFWRRGVGIGRQNICNLKISFPLTYFPPPPLRHLFQPIP